jgi:translation initiation factor 2 alpha subunit (eIF-2alpha)
MFRHPHATVKVDGQIVNQPPAQAIIETLKAALDDPNGKVVFHWSEDRTAMLVDVSRATAPNYSISVASEEERNAPGGHHDNDDDDI